MRVTVQRQLTSYALRKRSIQIRVLLRQLADDISTLLALLDHLELSVVLSQEVVQLGDQAFHSRNELDQALRDQYRTEVIPLGGTFSHDTSHVSNDIVQRHILLLNLLGDDTNVRLSLQSALQSDMRSGATHQFDEVPVFLGGVTVTLDVTDYLGVNLTSRVETERGLDLGVLQVAVDRLRATDYLYAGANSLVILGQYASVRVRIVTADNNQSLDIKLFQDLKTFIELLFRL